MTSISASLSSSAFFTPALDNFQNATNDLAVSTARLSSGNRLTRVSDDVASFSIATRLQSQLSGLKQFSQNIVQGDSLLQVAQGGLGQISDLLDQLNSTAVQANSASLTAADRTYLQQEFTQYLEEIDRIATTTSFNNIALLNGTLSSENKALTTTTQATQATATLTFTTLADTNNVILNGVTVTAGGAGDFAVGGDLQTTIDNLATFLNDSDNTALSNATYERVGSNALRITYDSGGTLGNQFTIDEGTSTATFTTAGGSTNVADLYTLSGGLDDGLNIGSTVATGSVGDTLVTTQSQVAASVVLTLTGAVSDGETLSIDDGDGGTIDFTFRNSPVGSTEIQIGSTTEETLQNIVSTLSQYSGADDTALRQLEFAINGSSLTISNRTTGNPTDLSGAVLDIAEGITNGALSATTFANGTNTGVSTEGLNNASFIGSVQGFSATYNSANDITATITVGGVAYTAEINDTDAVGAYTARFTSTTGGYFDVQIAAGGLAVADQDDADLFADRLDAAFSTLSFNNERDVSNFSATGSFIGGSADIQLGDFSDVRIDSISVTAPVGTDATIDITINGEIFRASSGIGGSLGAYESLTFTNLNDANETITLNNGSTEQDFSNTTNAATFQSALRSAFGLGVTGAGVDFQIGAGADDTVNVVVNDVRVDTLFNGGTPSVSSQSDAAAAQTAITTAKSAVLTTISRVGAIQRRFEFALDNIATTTEGITAARSDLADTDIAFESTAFAEATLRVNTGIAIIAQARNLQSSLLNALQFGNN
ncbi:MAG: flagellin [Rickettsiales bacterium]